MVERVEKLVGGIEGKRLTWRELTGKPQPIMKPLPRKPRALPMGPF